MSWDEPLWLAAAGVAALLLPVVAWRARWQRLQAARVASPRLWRRWLGGYPATGAGRVSLWLVAALFAAAGAAGPRWGLATGGAAGGSHVAIALDVSASMGVADVPPSRLARALAVLHSAVNLLPDADWSLSVGAGNAIPVLPLSADRELLLADLEQPGWRTAVAPGSDLAVLLATAAAQLPLQARGRTVILVSDGEELDGDAAEVADGLRARGITVLALQAGTPAGGPVPDPATTGRPTYLRESGGRLAHSSAHPDVLAAVAGPADNVIDAGLPAAAERLAGEISAAATAGPSTRAPHSRLFLLVAAVAATASFFLWPWRRVAPAALALLVVSTAGAGDTPRPVPTRPGWLPGARAMWSWRGEAAARRQEWGRARAAFAHALSHSPGDRRLELAWATAAAFEADPEGDAALERQCDGGGLTFEACYNLGTIELARGDASGAVKSLLRAVSLRPESREAWHNLELARIHAAHQQERAAAASARTTAPLDELVSAAARHALTVANPVPARPGPVPEKPW
ncbi:MAG: VWA domain-containing protein [Acidobacteriota bacterium]